MEQEYFMQQALALAQEAAVHGEVPVGCVIVHNGEIVGRGRNQREEKQAAVSHAEMEAIAQANAALGSWRLDECDLYVTLEPCPMCAGAIIQARIPRVVFGDKDDESGSLKYLRLLPESVRPDYETLVVTFGEPIRTLERRIFDDPQAWGVSTLKEWIDGYESTRFTQISDRTAVVTFEYNMASVREWLARHTEIETCKTA